jgi:hypothetical protein
MTRAFLEEVAAATHVTPAIAPFVVRRSLLRAGVIPADSVSPDSLREALPALEQSIAVYLDERQLQQAMADLRRLAA